MHLTFTGQAQPFSKEQTKKLDARFAKLGKLVDGKGEKDAHVIFSTQRGKTNAEVTLNYKGHAAVAAQTHADAFQALSEALDKLEKQVLKLRAKSRDTARRNAPAKGAEPAPARSAAAAKPAAPAFKRISVSARRKPMSPEEALLAIGAKDGYFAFRDSDSGTLSVLIRRADGGFDLVES